MNHVQKRPTRLSLLSHVFVARRRVMHQLEQIQDKLRSLEAEGGEDAARGDEGGGDNARPIHRHRPAALRRRTLSPMHGLRFFCERLAKDEVTVAAAYDEVRRGREVKEGATSVC